MESLHTLGPRAIELPFELIPKIAQFRLNQLGATGRRFSYVDSLGTCSPERTVTRS